MIRKLDLALVMYFRLISLDEMTNIHISSTIQI